VAVHNGPYRLESPRSYGGLAGVGKGVRLRVPHEPAVTLRGHGQSGVESDDPYRLELFADDVRDASLSWAAMA
jgi:hypothetical protein